MKKFNHYKYQFHSALLIDDNESDILLNKAILLNNKFTSIVHSAEGAMEGIRLLRELNYTDSGVPEIIFLDIQMPVMDGFGFLKEFHQLPDAIRHHTSIVMLTASTDIIDYYRAIRNPYVLNYMKKPFNLIELQSLAA